MEFHPARSLAGLPQKVIDGLHELREVIIGKPPEEPSNEDLSLQEAESVYWDQITSTGSGRQYKPN